jgi:hypothetical protein
MRSSFRWVSPLVLFVLLLLVSAVATGQRIEIEVPRGTLPSIDGTMSPGEWDNAVQLPMESTGTLFLMADDLYLYVAIHAGYQPVTNVYVVLDGLVNVLHASAALGSAIYDLVDDQWIQTDSYLPYACRSTRSSEESSYALWERTTFFENEGWFASNVYMGTPSDVEYQIPWRAPMLPLAIISMFANSDGLRTWLPADLDDDCWNRTLLYADDVSPLLFQPETWLQLVRSEAPPEETQPRGL